MKKTRLIIDTSRCKSCGYCVSACPRKALSCVRVEGKLYTEVVVDESACVGCGTCYYVCPDYVFELREEEGVG